MVSGASFERVRQREKIQKTRYQQECCAVLVQAAVERVLGITAEAGEQIRGAGQKFGEGRGFGEQDGEEIQACKIGGLRPEVSAAQNHAGNRGGEHQPEREPELYVAACEQIGAAGDQPSECGEACESHWPAPVSCATW